MATYSMSKVAIRVCACGCGVEVKSKWVRGHHSRVNNVSKRKDIREKRRKRFEQMHADGLLQPWNRGLTKEDPRVAEQSAQLDAWRRSSENVEKMSRQWKTGNIIPLRGPAHPNWKGGTSGITQRMRGSHQLYKLWKRPIMERDKFCCQDCGAGELLVVHHDDEKFAEIVRKLIFTLHGKEALERELTFDEGTHVITCVIDYHVREKVSGVTLCEQCHAKVHATD